MNDFDVAAITSDLIPLYWYAALNPDVKPSIDTPDTLRQYSLMVEAAGDTGSTGQVS